MNGKFCAAVVSGLLLAGTNGAWAAEASTDGATLGKWTMDLDAAKKLAAEKKLPILMNFSGSDWCGWCKLMEKNVFSKPAWTAYAKENLVMVLLDFPNDKSLVPEKYVARNDELRNVYKVQGFPTLILLDDDGETVLGQLGAGRDKTPESFIAELEPMTRYRAASIRKYIEGLSPKDKMAYKGLMDQLTKSQSAIQDRKQQVAKAQQEIETFEEKVKDLQSQAAEFRAARLGDAQLKEFHALKAKLEDAKKKLADWVDTSPERSEENTRKYRAMTGEIQELSSKLSVY